MDSLKQVVALVREIEKITGWKSATVEGNVGAKVLGILIGDADFFEALGSDDDAAGNV